MTLLAWLIVCFTWCAGFLFGAMLAFIHVESRGDGGPAYQAFEQLVFWLPLLVGVGIGVAVVLS